MAWDLPSKYAVGGDAPCYCHGPISHHCLGRRWGSDPVFIVMRAFPPSEWKILPEKKVGKWAHTFKSLYQASRPRHALLHHTPLVPCLPACSSTRSPTTTGMFGRLFPCLAATSHMLISPLLGIVMQEGLPSLVWYFYIFKSSHWLSVFYNIYVILATGKIQADPAGEKTFCNSFEKTVQKEISTVVLSPFLITKF